MAIDSTAELLFKINADANDAQGNIAKFRSLMGKDLDGMAAEFDSWSQKVFGDLTSVSGALLAGTAVLAAGAVAVGAAISEADKKYDEYVDAVSRGMKMTGLQAEQMSAMYLLAERAGVSYDSLVTGLLRFSSTVVKASEGGKEQQKAFDTLHVSQASVIAGQKDLMPLLAQTMDGFHNNTSAVQKASLARDLFGRGGTEMLTFLNKGSAGLREMSEEGHALGLILTNEDVLAAREFKLAMKELKEEQDAVDVAIGKSTANFRIWKATVEIGAVETIRNALAGKGFAVQTGNPVADFFSSIGVQADVAQKKIEAEIKAAQNASKLNSPPLVAPADVAKTTSEFYGLSTVIDQITAKTAGETSEYAKLNNEINHFVEQAQKAGVELSKLQSDGKITRETYQREAAALAQLPAMLAQLRRQTLQKLDAEDLQREAKQAEDLAELHKSLVDKLATYDTQDYEQKRASWAKEMDQLQQNSQKKAQLTDEEYKLLAEIRAAGLNKIAREQEEAFTSEIEKLQQHLEQMVLAELVGKDKLAFQYQQDLRAFSAAEEAKALKTAQGEAEQNTIRAFYAQSRALITAKYKNDLQTLLNSQGWQGVFGSHFASMIKGDEALMKQWATSNAQSLLLMKVAYNELKDVGHQAFESLAQGMGQNIAQAVVYSTSIGEAMRSALASTLESIAARCLVEALYASGLGFLRLAEHDVAGASAAFTAAAVFGSVGVAAAITGRAIAPSQSSSSASSSSSTSSSSDTSSTSSSASSASTQPTVIINVQGHIIGQSGAAELADILNQAVYGNDVTLYASHTRTGVPLG